MTRSVAEMLEVRPTIEGAGVHLRRGFGFGEVPRFDPFLLFDDFSSPDLSDYISGFPLHPHRGIETVTYLIEGEVRHRDSLGNEGVIRAGDVQWMTAGSGIVHEEMPQENREGIKGFQLWVNLPKKDKMMVPRYRDVLAKDMPVHEKGGVRVKVIAGTYEGSAGPVRDLMVGATYFDVALSPDVVFSFSVGPEDTTFMYVIDGSLFVGDNLVEVSAGQIARISAGDVVFARAGAVPARFLLVSGVPLREPVAWHGPIVMNTDAEIRTALQELRDGTFIKTDPKGYGVIS